MQYKTTLPRPDDNTAKIANHAEGIFNRFYDKPGVTRALALENLLLSAAWQFKGSLETVECVASALTLDTDLLLDTSWGSSE